MEVEMGKEVEARNDGVDEADMEELAATAELMGLSGEAEFEARGGACGKVSASIFGTHKKGESVPLPLLSTPRSLEDCRMSISLSRSRRQRSESSELI